MPLKTGDTKRPPKKDSPPETAQSRDGSRYREDTAFPEPARQGRRHDRSSRRAF